MKKLELKPTQSVEIDCGTVLPCAHWPNGCERVDWNKEAFKPLEGEITFIISNND